MKRIYFDYAAATPVDPRVLRAMAPFWQKIYGNPSSLHWHGQQASAALFEARRSIAASLGCAYTELVCTASATEANNLILQGIARAYIDNRKEKPKVIISALEHESITETCQRLKEMGAEIVVLPVNQAGIVNPESLAQLLDSRTALVSVMTANNEIGTTQPIKDIAQKIQNFRTTQKSLYPLFHTDAAQAFNYISCRVEELGVDALTLSGQKIYGPKGVGILYVRRLPELLKQKMIQPLTIGGGQEDGLRSGTENLPAIVGCAEAMRRADQLRGKESKRLQELQDYFLKTIKKVFPRAEINGARTPRLPNNINLYLPGIASQDCLIALDLAGYAVSAGAACSARAAEPSKVIQALGYSQERASQSIRITFGRQTTRGHVQKLLQAIARIVKTK